MVNERRLWLSSLRWAVAAGAASAAEALACNAPGPEKDVTAGPRLSNEAAKSRPIKPPLLPGTAAGATGSSGGALGGGARNLLLMLSLLLMLMSLMQL